MKSFKDEYSIDMINVSLIIAFLIIVLYPLYYLVIASFSDVSLMTTVPFLLWPRGFNLDNYKAVFESNIIWLGFKNSIFYLATGVALNIAMTLMAAYPLSKPDLPGKKVILKLIILSMYISGGMIPTYLVVRNLGMRDTFWAMIVPCAVNAFMVIISISFFQNTIPVEIQESGIIDGCSNIMLFIGIIIPLSIPLIGVLALQYGLGHWNSYAQALIYLNDRNKYPLQLVLREILFKIDSGAMLSMLSGESDYGNKIKLKEGIKYVSMVVSSVPLLILYPFLSRFFETGITLGAVKE